MRVPARLAVKPLLKLVGRMQMLQSQIAAQQAATQLEGANDPSDPALAAAKQTRGGRNAPTSDKTKAYGYSAQP